MMHSRVPVWYGQGHTVYTHYEVIWELFTCSRCPPLRCQALPDHQFTGRQARRSSGFAYVWRLVEHNDGGVQIFPNHFVPGIARRDVVGKSFWPAQHSLDRCSLGQGPHHFASGTVY